MLDWKDKMNIATVAEEKRAWGHARMANAVSDTKGQQALERFKRPAFSTGNVNYLKKDNVE